MKTKLSVVFIALLTMVFATSVQAGPPVYTDWVAVEIPDPIDGPLLINVDLPTGSEIVNAQLGTGVVENQNNNGRRPNEDSAESVPIFRVTYTTSPPMRAVWRTFYISQPPALVPFDDPQFVTENKGFLIFVQPEQ